MLPSFGFRADMRLTLIRSPPWPARVATAGALEAERLGGLDVDHQLEFGPPLIGRSAKRRLRLGDVRNSPTIRSGYKNAFARRALTVLRSVLCPTSMR